MTVIVRVSHNWCRRDGDRHAVTLSRPCLAVSGISVSRIVCIVDLVFAKQRCSLTTGTFATTATEFVKQCQTATFAAVFTAIAGANAATTAA